MQINERENERKPKVKRAKTNLEVLSTCWMEVFGLLNLKRRSKSQTCGTKIILRHHYYKLPRLNLDTQAFMISIPEIFASFLFIADRTSIIDVRHFDRVFSKFPYIGPVLDPSPSHLPLPPFFFFILFRLIVLLRTLKKYSKSRFQFASLHSPHPDLCPLGITIYSI